MRFFLLLAAASAVLCTGAVAALLMLAPRGVEVTRVHIEGPEGRRLVGDLWQPAGAPPAGGVLLCHGVETNKEVMAPLAAELARRRLMALAFDYGGYGESDRHGDELELMVEDSQAALSLLSHRLEAAGARGIAVIGHSMGATYAVELARRSGTVAAVVALGNEPVAPDVPPRNVAWGMGLYDAFHTLDAMIDVLRQSAADGAARPDHLLGSFAAGTARALWTSPLSDHGIEPLDPVLIAASTRWIERALRVETDGRTASTPRGSVAGDTVGVPLAGIRAAHETGPVPAPAVQVRAPYRAAAHMALFVAVVLLLAASGVLLASRMPRARGAALRLQLGVVAAAAAAGNLCSPRGALWWSDASLAALLASSVAAALVNGEQGPRMLPRARTRLLHGAGVLGMGMACLLAGLLAGGLPAAARLGEAARAPAFLLHILLLRPVEGLAMLRSYALVRYSEGWVPGIGLTVVIAAELARPGVVVNALAKGVEVLLRAFELRGPLRWHTSRRELVAAGVAFAVLAYFLARRFSEGWLTSEAVARMTSISLRFMILPLALFILAHNLLLRRRSARPGVER